MQPPCLSNSVSNIGLQLAQRCLCLSLVAYCPHLGVLLWGARSLPRSHIATMLSGTVTVTVGSGEFSFIEDLGRARGVRLHSRGVSFAAGDKIHGNMKATMLYSYIEQGVPVGMCPSMHPRDRKVVP